MVTSSFFVNCLWRKKQNRVLCLVWPADSIANAINLGIGIGINVDVGIELTNPLSAKLFADRVATLSALL
jgi:hypothetical protein